MNVCSVETCVRNDIVGHGLCARHYARERAGLQLSDAQRCAICEVEFISERTTARYCSRRCRNSAARLRAGLAALVTTYKPRSELSTDARHKIVDAVTT